MIDGFSYAYRRIRSWYVSPLAATMLAARYALTGDTGKFRTHGGFRTTRLRRARPGDDD